MKRQLFIAISILLCATPMIAKDETSSAEELSQWAESEMAKYPEMVDGVKVYYPSMDDKGKLSVSDLIDIEGKTQREIFTDALVYIYNNFDAESEVIESIDYESNRFIIGRRLKQGSGKTTTTYEYISAFQVADGILSFVSYDIRAEYREKGILPRKLDIEKLKPQENERHKELVEEFSLLNSKIIKNMSEYIASAKSETVTHWDEIKAGNVVKGMNKTEVKLAFGRPLNERETGKRTKWMYDNNAVVIFTNGLVTTVME